MQGSMGLRPIFGREVNEWEGDAENYVSVHLSMREGECDAPALAKNERKLKGNAVYQFGASG